MTEAQVVNGWIKEAVEQTQLEDGRKYLVRVLRKRFPTVLTEEVVNAINAQSSPDLLSDWLDVALAAFSGDEFLAALRRQRRRRVQRATHVDAFTEVLRDRSSIPRASSGRIGSTSH